MAFHLFKNKTIWMIILWGTTVLATDNNEFTEIINSRRKLQASQEVVAFHQDVIRQEEQRLKDLLVETRNNIIKKHHETLKHLEDIENGILCEPTEIKNNNEGILIFTSAKYGIDNTWIDVGSILMGLIIDNKLTIGRDVNINSLFTDPIFGPRKYLKVEWQRINTDNKIVDQGSFSSLEDCGMLLTPLII